MLDFGFPWEETETKGPWQDINDREGFTVISFFNTHIANRKTPGNQFRLIKHTPDLYLASKELIELKNKLWYQSLNEIDKGVFNSVLAKFEIAIEKIEKEAAHGA